MIIYGLGNNAPKYFDTRHNVGRLVVEGLVDSFNSKSGFMYAKKGEWSFLVSEGFMNESGLPLSTFIKYFKLPKQTLLVIQDDSDQFEGAIKLVQGGGSAGHRGIDSIYKHLLSTPLEMSDVWRVKIGIRPEGNRLKSETFVLSRNSSTILNSVQKVIQLLGDTGLDKDLQKMQNILNTKN